MKSNIRRFYFQHLFSTSSKNVLASVLSSRADVTDQSVLTEKAMQVLNQKSCEAFLQCLVIRFFSVSCFIASWSEQPSQLIYFVDYSLIRGANLTHNSKTQFPLFQQQKQALWIGLHYNKAINFPHMNIQKSESTAVLQVTIICANFS